MKIRTLYEGTKFWHTIVILFFVFSSYMCTTIAGKNEELGKIIFLLHFHKITNDSTFLGADPDAVLKLRQLCLSLFCFFFIFSFLLLKISSWSFERNSCEIVCPIMELFEIKVGGCGNYQCCLKKLV